jgi:hypothetical protein
MAKREDGDRSRETITKTIPRDSLGYSGGAVPELTSSHIKRGRRTGVPCFSAALKSNAAEHQHTLKPAENIAARRAACQTARKG